MPASAFDYESDEEQVRELERLMKGTLASRLIARIVQEMLDNGMPMGEVKGTMGKLKEQARMASLVGAGDLEGMLRELAASLMKGVEPSAALSWGTTPGTTWGSSQFDTEERTPQRGYTGEGHEIGRRSQPVVVEDSPSPPEPIVAGRRDPRLPPVLPAGGSGPPPPPSPDDFWFIPPERPIDQDLVDEEMEEEEEEPVGPLAVVVAQEKEGRVGGGYIPPFMPSGPLYNNLYRTHNPSKYCKDMSWLKFLGLKEDVTVLN